MTDSYPGMIVSARVILGMGVGLEGGTVPVYVAETAERRIRGNVVSLYQLNIALGEVLGYAVAAMFLHVKGNWRFILGSSLLFSSIMWAGMLFYDDLWFVSKLIALTACFSFLNRPDSSCTRARLLKPTKCGSAFVVPPHLRPGRSFSS